MNHEATVKRLCRIYDKADDATIEAGTTWYEATRMTCRHLADDYGYPLNVVAAAMAVLSPNITYAQNVDAIQKMVRAAADGLSEPVVSGFGRNRRKAWDILLTRDTTLVTGPKVSNFYANIIGDENLVTVDIWATRAALGRDVPGRDFAAIQRAYQTAARRRGVAPRDFQAVVWCVVRGGAR